MGWKECDRMSERLEFVRLASLPGANIAQVCKRFGVSRKTGYKWIGRWRQAGEEGLRDRSRRPVRSPGKTDDAIEREVLEVRKQHPAWGGRKIRQRLVMQGRKTPPSASTITEILRRHGCLAAEESAKHRPYTRFERSEPNELWQVDFKGEFALGRRGLCYPLTILDDHSRYSLGLFACGNQKRSTVQNHFRNVFERYGLPRGIYVDNGNPWGTKDQGFGHTRFTAWLLRHDVDVIHGRPYHPQGRGKLERFHRTLKLELLQGRQFTSLVEAQGKFDPWRAMYNHQRPHESLDLNVPSSRYRVSDRMFEEAKSPYQYSDRFEVRQAARYGQFSFHGSVYRVSEAFAYESIGLSPGSEDGVWSVHYCRYRIGVLDERTKTIRRHQPLS